MHVCNFFQETLENDKVSTDDKMTSLQADIVSVTFSNTKNNRVLTLWYNDKISALESDILSEMFSKTPLLYMLLLNFFFQ